MKVRIQSLRTVDGIAIPFETVVPLEEASAVIAEEECKPGVLLDLEVVPLTADMSPVGTNGQTFTEKPKKGLDNVGKRAEHTFRA